jgi:hypothetical protein
VAGDVAHLGRAGLHDIALEPGRSPWSRLRSIEQRQATARAARLARPQRALRIEHACRPPTAPPPAPQVSGTTATVAAVVGWELLVANVGDSCAYLDTGAEVLLVRAAAGLG